MGGPGLGAFWLPHLPSLLFLWRPPCLHVSVVSGPGCPGPRRFLAARAHLLVAFLFFCAPAVRWFPPLAALGLGFVWLGFFFLPRARPFMWCVSCALMPPPPPPGGCSWCFVVSRVFLCGAAVSCGLFCVVRVVVRCFCAPRCAGVRVPCCLVCCPVVLLVLSLAVSRSRWLRRFCWCRVVPCFAVLCCAVICCVCRRRARLCVVVFPLLPSGVVVHCAVWASGPLRRAALCWLCWVVLLCPPPLLLRSLSGLLLLPGPLSEPVVVLCTGVPCCVVLLCRLSSVVLLSASFPAVLSSASSFALAGAGCCCLLFLGVQCWVCLSAVVSWWRSLSLVSLSGRVACCPVVCCGSSLC